MFPQDMATSHIRNTMNALIEGRIKRRSQGEWIAIFMAELKRRHDAE